MDHQYLHWQFSKKIYFYSEIICKLDHFYNILSIKMSQFIPYILATKFEMFIFLKNSPALKITPIRNRCIPKITFRLDSCLERALTLKIIQVWNFLGFLILTATGVNSLVVWSNAKAADTMITTGKSQDYARNYNAALAMGSLCLIAGIVYFVDFIVAVSARKRFKREAY